jgi:hypothetical protein
MPQFATNHVLSLFGATSNMLSQNGTGPISIELEMKSWLIDGFNTFQRKETFINKNIKPGKKADVLGLL